MISLSQRYGESPQSSPIWWHEDEYPLLQSQGLLVPHSSYLRPALHSMAAGRFLRDPSGVTFRVESICISSCMQVELEANAQLKVEYCLGTSSPGSTLFHSFLIRVWASSKTARLGVISEARSWTEDMSV